MKTLLVASEGGHLAQLHMLSERMGPAVDRVWVTFDTPQSHSLLVGQEVHFAPFAGTRDLVGTARIAVWARNKHRTRCPTTRFTKRCALLLYRKCYANRWALPHRLSAHPISIDSPSHAVRVLG